MPTPQADIRIGTVSEALAQGVEDLTAFNWDEVYRDKFEMPLDVDWSKLLMLERMGQYKALVAHAKGKLVGYNGYFLQPPIRHKASVWAVNDTIYVEPEHRASTIGLRLLKAAEPAMKGFGAKLLLQGNLWPDDVSTSGKARARFGALLIRLGYAPVENVYAKLL